MMDRSRDRAAQERNRDLPRKTKLQPLGKQKYRNQFGDDDDEDDDGDMLPFDYYDDEEE